MGDDARLAGSAGADHGGGLVTAYCVVESSLGAIIAHEIISGHVEGGEVVALDVLSKTYCSRQVARFGVMGASLLTSVHTGGRCRSHRATPPRIYELEERGWTVTEFSEIVGRPVEAVSELLDAEKSVMPDTALSFSEALGTSVGLWLNLQTAYRLHQRRSASDRGEPTPGRQPCSAP